MFHDRWIELLILLSVLIVKIDSLENLCLNVSLNDRFHSKIHSWNFYQGERQPNNLTCSWFLPSHDSSSNGIYQLSLRVIEIESDPQQWSNSLIFRNAGSEIIHFDIKQRFWEFSAKTPLEIEFRAEPPINSIASLNIRRFLLEWTYRDENTPNTFQCQTTGHVIPAKWRCNCLGECMTQTDEIDVSDEANCSLCSMFNPFENLFCQSDEYWCLPETKTVKSSSLPGACVPRDYNGTCLYSTQKLSCSKVLIFSKDQGELYVSHSMFNGEQSLCFVIVTKVRRQLQLQLHDLFRLDLSMYDGNQLVNLLSSTSKLYFGQYLTQHPVAVVMVQEKINPFFPLVSFSQDQDKTLLNMTWSVSICPENQMQCGGNYEKKCYTKQQRCDGMWDCINGDDELGCLSQYCPNTFSCNDQFHLASDLPRCYSWHDRCNGYAYCANRMDERFCSSWWCNSNNGTFLCHNQNCIYEVWVCDGQDDCGDNSDEQKCSSQIPRRIMTSIVIGITICSTLFIIALSCSIKLYRLRSLERRTTIRSLNPQNFLRRRSSGSNDNRRMAPPTYNQTMGFSEDHEERYALLTENLRLAGLTDMISIATVDSSQLRRTRRHRRRRNRETYNSGRFHRFDLLRSLFLHSNEYLQPNEFEINEQSNPIPHELPPDYATSPALHISSTNHLDSSTSSALLTGGDTSSTRQQPKQVSNCLLTSNDERNDEDQTMDSDDDKMLMP